MLLVGGREVEDRSWDHVKDEDEDEGDEGLVEVVVKGR